MSLYLLQGIIRHMHKSKNIVLATLNAKYIHAAFGLRYLKANLHEHEEYCRIQEFTVDVRAEDAVEQLLELQPSIIGFGVYIWNVEQIGTRLCHQARTGQTRPCTNPSSVRLQTSAIASQ